MMTIAQRIAALAAGVALLAGCGGGSSPSAPAATTAPKTANTGTPIASASLTVKFPANFHTARKASSAKRGATYVNPTTGNLIDIFVDGTDVLPGYAVSSANSDGTQTITGIPLYSTQAHQIVVVESNSGGYQGGQILALGETDLPAASFTPGDAVTLGLTMAMNVSTIGITSDPTNGVDAAITSAGSPYNDGVCAPGSGHMLYLFAADAEQGFLTGAGLGVAIPSLISTVQNGSNPPITVATDANGLLHGYVNTYQNFTGGIIYNTTVANPAYALAIDAYYNQGLYPGLRWLYTDGTLSNVINTIFSNGQTISAQVYIVSENFC